VSWPRGVISIRGVLADIVIRPQVKGEAHRLAVVAAEQRLDVLLEADRLTGGRRRRPQLIHLLPLLILGHGTIMTEGVTQESSAGLRV
jgi:hypothetical protein